jgi:serine/threonine protein kinase
MISRTREVGVQADSYSLGATLYELLTGRPPFEDPDPERVMAAHLAHAVPNPRRWCPELDHGVSRLLRDLLAKEPLRRPADTELVARLVELEIAALWERAA